MPTAAQLEKLGIEKEPIASYSPEQNGVPEAMNKTIIRQITKMIDPFKSCNYLPLLPHIIKHATYLLNQQVPIRHQEEGLPLLVDAYEGNSMGKHTYRRFGSDVLVKIHNAQEARTVGIELDKFTILATGIYLGHSSSTVCDVLLGDTVIQTNNVQILDSMTRIFHHFARHATLDIDSLSTENGVDKQLQHGEIIKQHRVSDNAYTTTEDPSIIEALDELVLNDEVHTSHRVADYAVPGLTNVFTTGAVPDDNRDIEPYNDSVFLPEQTPTTHRRDTNSGTGEHSKDEYDSGYCSGQGCEADLEPLIAAVPLCTANLLSLEREENNHFDTTRESEDSSHLSSQTLTGTTQTDHNSSTLTITPNSGIDSTSESDMKSSEGGTLTGPAKIRVHDKNQGEKPGSAGGNMIKTTRSGRQVKMPTRFRSINFIGMVRRNNNHAKAIVKRNGSISDWDKAEADEIRKFQAMKVYDVVPIPKGANIIRTVWVYTYKQDDIKGAVYNARLVVQGSRQIENIHFNNYRKMSPVVETTAIKVLTAVATEETFVIHHLDIKLAYLNAPLKDEEQILVKPPPGHDESPGYC